jgi:hypothetical protein
MKMEHMLLKDQNILDDVQSGGDNVILPTLIKNSDLSAPEIPISEIPISKFSVMPVTPISPIPYVTPSPSQEFPTKFQKFSKFPKFPTDKFSTTATVGDGLSPTVIMDNSDRLSPTVVMSEKKKKVRVNDKVSITDLDYDLVPKSTDESFQDTLLDGIVPNDQTTTDPSMVFGTPPDPVNKNDPLNISNTPSRERDIDKRRYENFKVNGRVAEGLSPRPEKSKKRLSKNQKFRNSKFRYLDLSNKVPIPKDFTLNPFGNGPYFEVEDITDIKDSTLQSNMGYDLKVKWKLMPGETVNQETWEPVENLQECKDLMKKFKESKIFSDYLEYKKLSNVYSKPKVSKKSRSYKGIDIQSRRQQKNLKELRAAQAFDDYASKRSSNPSTSESGTNETNLRRSARLKANVVPETREFDSIYFGSVPGYVDIEEKARIDKVFLDFKNFSAENLYDDDTSLEVPSVEEVMHQALVNEEYRRSEEVPKPPNYDDHPHRTPGNKELNQQILRSIDKVLAEVGIDEDAPKTRSAMLKTKYEAEFKEAELSELDSIDKHGTFEEVELPKGAVPITCRWVYDFKRNKEGKCIRFKARLVVQGYKQQEGIDFDKTFSSTAQIRSFRTMVALCWDETRGLGPKRGSHTSSSGSVQRGIT